MNTRNFIIYFVIGVLVCGVGIWIIYDIVKHKKLFTFENLRLERNQSNERYEILPEMNVPKHKNQSNTIATPLTVEQLKKKSAEMNASIPIKPVFMPTPVINDKVERFENSTNIKQTFPDISSTFCTCGGLIDQTCEDTTNRVNSYNSGKTEFSKFPNKNWSDVMPYDQYIQQPNYEHQNTHWQDVMPYDIYQSKN